MRLSKKPILEVWVFSVVPIFQFAIFGSINFNSLNKSVVFRLNPVLLNPISSLVFPK